MKQISLTLDLLDGIVAIEQMTQPKPWTRGQFTDALNAGYWTQVLLNAQDEVQAYIVAMAGVQEAHLLNLAVAPSAQRQGLAKQLMQTLRQWAIDTQAEQIWLEVRQSNARAIGLYQACGYTHVAVRKAYYPAHNCHAAEDACVMCAKL